MREGREQRRGMNNSLLGNFGAPSLTTEEEPVKRIYSRNVTELVVAAYQLHGQIEGYGTYSYMVKETHTQRTSSEEAQHRKGCNQTSLLVFPISTLALID